MPPVEVLSMLNLLSPPVDFRSTYAPAGAQCDAGQVGMDLS